MANRKIQFTLIFATLLSIAGACEKESEREGKEDPSSGNFAPQTTPTPTPGATTTPPTSEVTTTSGPGVSPDSCTTAGTAWVAAPGENISPACGDKLATFKPCLDQVTARFPSVATAVTKQHNDYVSDQNKLMLYAVSEVEGKITMHYMKQNDSGFSYASISFSAFKIEPKTAPPVCAQEHNNIPGLNGATTDGSTTDGSTTDGATTGGT
jgi:hypothetical protein